MLIDNKFEKFDIAWLEENGTSMPLDNNIFTYEYRGKKDSSNYFLMGNKRNGYTYLHYFENKYHKIVKHYYPNGNIKEKGFMVNSSDTKTETWYEFDENGKLTKTINYDKLTDLSLNDVLRFCELEKITIKSGYQEPFSGFYNSIYRYYDENSSSYIWAVRWLKKHNLVEYIRLDGKTGKIREKTEEEYENN